jgi:very-short-patch-repair endonuclease
LVAWDVDPRDGSRRPATPNGGPARDVCRISSWPDRLVAEAADAQYGVVTRRQLLALGLTRSLVDHAVARGRLIGWHRGVYALARRSSPAMARYLAAVLAVGEDALLSHHAAAAVWGLRPSRAAEVDVTVVARDAGRRRPGIRVHRRARMDDRDRARRHNIPITSAALTLLDLTPELGMRELERIFDAALKERIVTRAAVEQTAARNPTRPGAGRLAALARSELAATTVSRSDGEERFLELVRAGGLPDPELNAQIGPYTVDAFWRDVGLVVEIDGYGFHGTRRSFDTDHERDQYLSARDLTVLRFTRDQVVKQPAVVLVRLTQRLTALSRGQSGRSRRIVS